jgi:hypothetical protein
VIAPQPSRTSGADEPRRPSGRGAGQPKFSPHRLDQATCAADATDRQDVPANATERALLHLSADPSRSRTPAFLVRELLTAVSTGGLLARKTIAVRPTKIMSDGDVGTAAFGGPSALAKNDPFLLAQSDPLLKQDLELGNGFGSASIRFGSVSYPSSTRLFI